MSANYAIITGLELRDLSPDEHLVRGQAIESAARSYPRRIPITVSEARGLRLTDTRGQTFIDCLACAGALPLGHNHPEVNAAVIDYLQSNGPSQALDLMTSAKSAFMDALFGVLPAHWREDYRVLFCGPGGSDAVEAATKLARIATGNETILSFQGGYHGMSQSSLGLTGNHGAKKGLPGNGGQVQFLPYPVIYRSPFGSTEFEAAERNFRYINDFLHDPESGIARPAGMILEMIQGEGGVNPAPVSWLQRLRRLTRSLRIPMIVDEVQTGLGRTGDMFAFQHAGIEPDILVLSKAIGGGFPLAVVVYRKELDVWGPGAHAGTFRGNQIAMVAGAKTIEILVRDGIVDRVREMGAFLRQELQRLADRFAFIGNVRGRGLMLGMEIVSTVEDDVDAQGYPAPAPNTARRLQRLLLERGLIVEPGGRFGCVLRFLPPLTLDEEDVERIVAILDAGFTALSREAEAEG